MSFRLPLDFWVELQEKHGLKTGNEVADFLKKLYDQTFCPIVGVPTNERQAPQNGKKVGRKSTVDLPEIDLNNDPDFKKVTILLPQDYRPEDIARMQTLQAEIEKGAPKELSPLGKKNFLFDRNKEINTIKAKYEIK